ncbi:uncharacterized protein LOC117110816 isoform X2 [Anneissia japonica]|uniref:uncharacterized protein LOC117110816 isoform X2 n=1 Tax=Anneissia japonica TaxID=1529436 RepID=UPI001425921F|nr:uncharacterized protein LOC117110816 isoform X2 [Anneissia japonica]
MISTAGVLVLFFDVAACIEGSFYEKPMNATFSTGGTASLKCDADYAHRVVWYHNSSATKISDNWGILLSDGGGKGDRYSVCCDSTVDRTYTLEITDFQLIDAGLYSCMILQEHNDIFKSASAVLSIDPPGEMTPPDYTSPSCDIIRIYRNTNELLDVGDDIVFRCQSQGGNPLPQLTVIDGEEVIDIETVLDGETQIVNYSVSLNTSHINSNFTCKLVSAALGTPRYCSLKPLILGVVIMPPQITAVEGADIVFDCYSKGAKSPEFTWQWRLNNSGTPEKLIMERI